MNGLIYSGFPNEINGVKHKGKFRFYEEIALYVAIYEIGKFRPKEEKSKYSLDFFCFFS